MSSQPAIPNLEDHTGFWLRMVSNHVSQAFAAKLASKGVTVAEWCVMRTLFERPPTPPSQIASQMGMTRGAITRLADRLIAKLLIIRESSPADGRAQTLALTPKGARLVPELAALADRNDAEFFACLTAAERSDLVRLLRHLARQGQISEMPTR